MTPPPLEINAQPGEPLGMTAVRFLHDYWQKRPLLIRGAFPDFELPLTPDDLGGLACEDMALARLIQYERSRDEWTVHTGPLEESLFATLPDRDWTLLVQDVDKWDADVAALLAHFRFLPAWRIDDIMVSYAEDGGGVGAHLDHYDVFLLQGLGKRRWSIDARDDPPVAFRDDVPLKLLRTFSPSHAFTLAPGDMLYLPPGIPHDGVAEGPCMTFSIGMRAPSRGELLLDFVEHLAERMPESERYADPDLERVARTGEIDAAALARVATTLGPAARLADPATLADWFGRFITRYRSAQWVASPPDAADAGAALDRALEQGHPLARHPFTRMAWIANAEGASLYVAGEAFTCSRALAEALYRDSHVLLDAPPDAHDRAVLQALIAQGHLLPASNDA
jgi:50S ribosomal protein L16 3-hydroxylase